MSVVFLGQFQVADIDQSTPDPLAGSGTGGLWTCRSGPYNETDSGETNLPTEFGDTQLVALDPDILAQLKLARLDPLYQSLGTERAIYFSFGGDP